MRILFASVLLQLLLLTSIRAATCTDHMTHLTGHPILSTMTYYARPGQENVVYASLVEQNEKLAARGIQTWVLYRGPGGSQPAAFWTLPSADFAAHDAWLKQVEKALPDDPVFDAAVLRMEHRHYVMHDGWTDSPTCK